MVNFIIIKERTMATVKKGEEINEEDVLSFQMLEEVDVVI